jgi:hypothetical protein
VSADSAPPPSEQPPPWWLRAYLFFAAFQGFGIGLTGLLLPAEIQIPLRITPLNARFVAALYIAGGLGVLLAAFARTRADTRIFVIGFGVATALILVLTGLHWSEFTDDALPHRPVWLFDYIVDPIMALAVVVAARLWPPPPPRRHRLTGFFSGQALIFGVAGATLVLIPGPVAAAWPWALPPVLAQLYGCFFLTFAVGAGFAAREDRPVANRNLLLSTLLLAVLVLLASVLHFDRFKPEPVTWLWFGAFALGALACLAALTWMGRDFTGRDRQLATP